MSPRTGLDMPTILQNAAEIADQEGIEAVTLASLAKKLNIRPPSLYNHFDGLTGLRKHLAIYGLERLYEKLSYAAIGRSGDEAVYQLGITYVDFARTHPGLYEATLLAPDPADLEVQKAGQKIVDLATRVLSVYGLKDDAAIHAVRGLRSILHGFASLEQRGGFGLPISLDKSLSLLIQAFLAGIHVMKQKGEE
ncbi:TetR family transcriptional regulator [Bacillus methanolicus]|uniref:TetR/AcrR family transcriptional regulator n=1 Tax=Bacillus methanolicus TaxID=1471 RepID=UPI002380767B|nr:TetR/AcrR family transcriptional regulator [Bacillus methanolicus]MDE3838948.1 TetR family transcriptional regulator [Bacillus methanolicus]